MGTPAAVRILFEARNNTGTLTLNVSGNTFSNTRSSTNGSGGISLTAVSNAAVDLNASNNDFLNLKTSGIETFARDTSTMSDNITDGGTSGNGNVFDPQGGTGRAIGLNAEDSAQLDFNINRNAKIYGSGGPIINVFGINSAVIQGRIDNNTDIRGGGNGATGSPIFLHPEDNSSAIIEVLSNTISGVGNNPGIFAISHGDGGANHSATLDVTIQSNTITIASTNPGGVPGIDTRAGSNAGDTIKTCVDVMNNVVTLGSGGSDAGWLTREGSSTAGNNLYLEGMIAGASNGARAINTWNARGNTPSGSTVAFDAGGAAAYTTPPAGAPYFGVCRTPSNLTAMQPNNNHILAQNQPETNPMVRAQVVSNQNVHAAERVDPRARCHEPFQADRLGRAAKRGGQTPQPRCSQAARAAAPQSSSRRRPRPRSYRCNRARLSPSRPSPCRRARASRSCSR